MKQLSRPSRLKHLLAVLPLVLLWGVMPARAAAYFEGFDTATGNEDYLYSLPEGWDVVGSMRDFSLSKRYYKTSSPALCYTSGGNTADYLVTPAVQGAVSFWYYGTNSRTKGTLQVFEVAEQDGQLVVGDQLGETISTPTQSWSLYSITLTSARRLAILMSRTAIDDFSAEQLGGDSGGGDDNPPVVEERRALQLTAFERLSDYEVVADEQNQMTIAFSVSVRNVGNVALEGSEVSVSIVDRDGEVVATQTADVEQLAVDGETQVALTVVTDAGQGGYMSFYARENLTNTFALNEQGNPQYQNVHVTAFYATFDIKGPDGLVMWDDDVVSFGYTNEPVSRQITIINDGTAPLQVSSITLPDGFSASATAFSVEAGGKQDVVLTLTPEEGKYGQKGGKVEIVHAVGTFSFSVSGITVDPDLYFANFEAETLPEGWAADEGWSVSSQSGNHYAQQNSTAGATNLVSPKLRVAEGERLIFQLKRAFAYSPASLSLYYSADSVEWTLIREYEGITSAFQTAAVSGLPAGDYYFAFQGQYVAIDNFIGFHPAPEQPEVDDPEDPNVEPDDPNVEPDDPNDEPDDPNDEPDDPNDEPDDPNDEPDDPIQEPDDPNDEPKEDPVTGVGSVNPATKQARTVVDLNGRRSTSARGLVIIGGKKYYIK